MVTALIFVLAAIGLLVSKFADDSTAAWVMLGLLVAAIVLAKSGGRRRSRSWDWSD